MAASVLPPDPVLPASMRSAAAKTSVALTAKGDHMMTAFGSLTPLAAMRDAMNVLRNRQGFQSRPHIVPVVQLGPGYQLDPAEDLGSNLRQLPQHRASRSERPHGPSWRSARSLPVPTTFPDVWSAPRNCRPIPTRKESSGSNTQCRQLRRPNG